MKRKIFGLVLVGVFILSFLTLNLQAKDELGLFFSSGKSLYAKPGETLHGISLQSLISDKSYCMDVYANFKWRKNPPGIDKLETAQLKVQAEKSWKCFVASLIFDWYEEEIYQSGNIDTIERWDRKELIAGLGFKMGRYDKSFIRISGVGGVSGYQNNSKLPDINEEIEENWSEIALVGGNIKARLKVNIMPIWIDFQSSYHYYPKDEDYRVEAKLGSGIRVTKRLGVKGNIAVIQTREKRFSDYYNYSLGLVLIF